MSKFEGCNTTRKKINWVILLGFASFALAGYQHAALSYKLQRWGTTTILVPPSQRSAGEKSGLLVANFKNARRKSVSVNCDVEGPVVAMHWHGRAAEIRVKSEAYVAERSESAESRGEASGMYLDPLQDIGRF